MLTRPRDSSLGVSVSGLLSPADDARLPMAGAAAVQEVKLLQKNAFGAALRRLVRRARAHDAASHHRHVVLGIAVSRRLVIDVTGGGKGGGGGGSNGCGGEGSGLPGHVDVLFEEGLGELGWE